MLYQKIDILRFIGLALIILAHSGVSGIFFQVRNFDVPLMVLISGLSFQLAFKSESYSDYLIKRIKRLVFPVWIFLTFYFFIRFAIDPSSSQLKPEVIRESYLFLGGIGYVWIIRVFLLVALVAPFLYAWSRKELSNTKFLGSVIIAYIGYEILYAYLPHNSVGAFNTFIEATVFYILPYAAVFSIGLRLINLSKRETLILLALMLIVFSTIATVYYLQDGKLIPTQIYKYPPRAYYLSYAIIFSLITWIYVDRLIELLQKLKVLKLVDFAGRNSIWMYLWHIPLIELVTLPTHFKYPVVIICSFLLTWLQVKLLRSVIFSKLKSERLKSNLNQIFTG